MIILIPKRRKDTNAKEVASPMTYLFFTASLLWLECETLLKPSTVFSIQALTLFLCRKFFKLKISSFFLENSSFYFISKRSLKPI
ncbi:unnamed protein product [Moneuplotes crassus]|uniref:Uncharacterized protein n=1 Tax=Euplotes crassus TaxID=5936 RepID=A0AAD1X9S1_EUPCR|nr:unnamed protein product [Moneuplotes crassus]